MTLSQAQQDRAAVLDWLSPLEAGQAHDRATLNRLEGTCQWFLHDSKFIEWADGTAKPNCMIAHGVPGCGKTLLSSFVIDELALRSADNTGLAFVYFEHMIQDKQGASDVLANIVKQLCEAGQAPLPQALVELHDKHRSKGTRPPLADLRLVFSDLGCQFDRTYIIIDAVDECEQSQCRKLLECLMSFMASSKVRIFLTCRSFLTELLDPRKESIQIPISAQASDLTMYISIKVADCEMRDMITPTLQQEITQKLIASANGM